MKIDLMSALYHTAMIILIFVAALVATNAISKWIRKKNTKDKSL